MQVEILRNSRVLAGAMDFDAAKVRDIVARQGGNSALVPNGLTGVLNIGSIVIKPVQIIKPALTRMEVHGAAVRTETDSLVTYTYSKESRDIELVRDDLMRTLSTVHEQHDMGTAVHNGVTIKTDLEARINSRLVIDAFSDGSATSGSWNGVDGQIPLADLADIQAIKTTIDQHLALGFAAKASVRTLLEAANSAELETVNVKAEFDEALAAIAAAQAA